MKCKECGADMDGDIEEEGSQVGTSLVAYWDCPECGHTRDMTSEEFDAWEAECMAWRGE